MATGSESRAGGSRVRTSTKASRRKVRSYQDSIRGASKKSIAGVPF